MALMSPMTAEEQARLMQAPASPDFKAVQHPMHAIVAPIGPAPPELGPDVAQGMSPDQPSVPSAVEGKKPKVTTMSPLERYEEKQSGRLMSDMQKDANPYGSAGNHPGFFGKLLHGLSVATGGPNRRAFEEQGLAKSLNENENEVSKRGLEGAQAENATASAGHLNAETPEVGPNAQSTRQYQSAEKRHLDDESDALESPKPTYSVHDTDAGPLFVNNQTGTAQHLSVDGVPVGPKLKLTQSPPTLGPDGKPHTYMLDEKGQKVADLGVHYERPITINNNPERKERGEIVKVYQPALDSAERFNVMSESYEKAIKDHDQQAMLNLLANHLGMTMGLQKGARLTKDIVQEAQHSQPWLQGIKAHFDGDGYLSGVALSPNQMRQMVALGQERYSEDVKKSRATGQYLGNTDDGPQRIPGKATINFYLGRANGDAARAKQLAAADGWSVQ